MPEAATKPWYDTRGYKEFIVSSRMIHICWKQDLADLVMVAEGPMHRANDFVNRAIDAGEDLSRLQLPEGFSRVPFCTTPVNEGLQKFVEENDD